MLLILRTTKTGLPAMKLQLKIECSNRFVNSKLDRNMRHHMYALLGFGACYTISVKLQKDTPTPLLQR